MSVDPYDIAVTGLACRFPGAPDVRRFWENLIGGVESIRFFGKQELETGLEWAGAPNFVPAFGALEDVYPFDASFFRMSRREAEFLDPQIRLLLECAVEAMEDGGQLGAAERNVGVYVGASPSTYAHSLQ